MTSALLRALVWLRVRRGTDYALLLALYVAHGLCARALTAPPILRKWANAWQQTWWVAGAGITLGALEDGCVCACACFFFWLIDRCVGSGAQSASGPQQRKAAALLPQTTQGAGRGDAHEAASSPSSLSVGDEWREWMASLAPTTLLRFVGYMLVFLVSNACFCVDAVLVRTRQMRFTSAFVQMYVHERDAASRLQVDDAELGVLYEQVALTVFFAIVVGYLGAVWINLTEWDVLRALHRFRVRRMGWEPTQELYENVQTSEDDASKGENAPETVVTTTHTQLTTLPRRICNRMSTRTLFIVLLLTLFAGTIVLSKLVPSIVAVLALNSSLNEPYRLVLGLELFSVQQTVSVSKRMADFVETATEDATMLSPNALYRRTNGFRGPLAFNVKIMPNERVNVLVLVIESFRQRDSRYLLHEQQHLLPNNMTLTPRFDQWAARGIGFRNMWSSWRTSRALETILFGQVPYDSITATGTTNGRAEVALSGLPQLFAAKGYECLFTTGTRTDYEDWDTFLPSHGFDTVLDGWDLAEIAAEEIGIDWTIGDQVMAYWGVHDHLSFDVLGYLLQKHQKHQQNSTISNIKRPANETQEEATETKKPHKDTNGKKPWFMTHFTISSHVPFDERPDWYYKYQDNIPDFSAFYKGHEHEELLKNYAEMRYYTDLTFGHFMDNLNASGVLNDTIVFVVGDHGQAPERGSATPEQDQMSATRVAGALIAEGRLAQEYVGLLYDDVASHSDILNTLADIVGVPDDGFLQSGVGHSLKRSRPFGERIVHSNNPAVNMAAVQGHTRMQYYSEVSDAVQVYHTEFDPLQQHDLMQEHMSAQRIKEIFEICAEGRMLSAYFKHRWDNACILAPTC
uniref:Sulfatase N-terminal domain-containing protein n=1 Tax=Globisporangium ultimum (strain ATCC 200006 / CBS 805.95 / DAOM BR144) TaxID=431595 RepID=K3X2U4_GLOUD